MDRNSSPGGSRLAILFVVVLLVGAAAPVAGQEESVLQFRHAVLGPSRGVLFRNPQGIAWDRERDEIYVADTGNRAISVFDDHGRLLFSFPYRVNDPKSGQEIVAEPRSIAVDRDGTIYITDTVTGVIQVRDYRGEPITTIDVAKKAGIAGQRVIPEYLCLDTKGNLYVTTGGDVREVIVLDARAEVVRRIRGIGEGFRVLTGVWVDEGGTIYITDATAAPAVQVYDPTGAYLFGFGEKEIGDPNFSHPHGVVTTAGGDIWVVDSIRQVIKRFDRQGRFLEMHGGFGVNAGDLLYPVGIAGDGDTRLVVLERVGARYQSFTVETGEGTESR